MTNAAQSSALRHRRRCARTPKRGQLEASRKHNSHSFTPAVLMGSKPQLLIFPLFLSCSVGQPSWKGRSKQVNLFDLWHSVTPKNRCHAKTSQGSCSEC